MAIHLDEFCFETLEAVQRSAWWFTTTMVLLKAYRIDNAKLIALFESK